MDEIASVRPAASTGAEFTNPFTWLRSEIDRLFDDAGRPARSIFQFGERAPTPALEMVEDDKAYRLSAELPGLAESDLTLTIADGRLTLAGEKREESRSEGKGMMLSERRYGAFERQVPLPADVDPDAVRATFKDGVLTVTLPKDADAAPRTRRIPIG
jgi:HSP20 family protein